MSRYRTVAIRRLVLVPALAAALWACDLGIQAGTARVQTDEANMLGDSEARPRPATPPALPPLPTLTLGDSRLHGVDPAHLRARARAHSGKGLVVNFWASFCGSCKDEIPLLLGVSRDYGSRGIELVMITADEPEDRPKAATLLRELGGLLESHYVHGGVGAFKRQIEPRWRGALPATLLIDTTGKVRHFWNGPVIDDEVRPVLDDFLAGRSVDGMTNVAGSANP